jgi:hypothetical protein
MFTRGNPLEEGEVAGIKNGTSIVGISTSGDFCGVNNNFTNMTKVHLGKL